MYLFNQPHERCVGETLREILGNNDGYGFDTFYILVAYARTSGVSRIQNEIENFKATGGQVRAVVGMGHNNTRALNNSHNFHISRSRMHLAPETPVFPGLSLSLIHISEPTRPY